MSALTAAQILEAKDRVVEKVDVKEWGGEVYVRMLSTAEAIKLNACIKDVSDTGALMAAQLAAFMCDENGAALFADAEAAAALLNRAHAPLSRVLTAGQKLNHAHSPDDEKKD